MSQIRNFHLATYILVHGFCFSHIPRETYVPLVDHIDRRSKIGCEFRLNACETRLFFLTLNLNVL
jgi:hypothetical protein